MIVVRVLDEYLNSYSIGVVFVHHIRQCSVSVGKDSNRIEVHYLVWDFDRRCVCAPLLIVWVMGVNFLFNYYLILLFGIHYSCIQ